MSEMRVAIFGWAHSAHVQRWVRGLKARGLKMRLVSLGGEPLPDIDTHILPRRGRLSYFTQASQASRLAREFKPDIVHAHYASGFGWWTRKIKDTPTIVSAWGADVIDFPSNSLKRSLLRSVLKGTDHITATSRMLKQATVAILPEIEGKTTVIPFGVTIPHEDIPAPPDQPLRLCFIKAHRRKYGPDILLQALALARKSNPEIVLDMAGQGEMTSHLKAMCHRLGIEKAVNFVGYIPPEEIYSFLSQHHIMVMPSVMASESFGVAVLEASACGRPVIASRIGGVPEVVRDGETGLLVPPGEVQNLTEAILALAADRERREKMGLAGRKFVSENYLWEKSLDAMIELYERVRDEGKR